MVTEKMRYATPRTDTGKYYRDLKAHRADPKAHKEPKGKMTPLVSTIAVQDGEEVEILVYEDQVADYEAVLAEWREAQAEAAGEEVPE